MNRSNEEFRQLERMMFCAWPAFDAVKYDGWVLRFADGYTKRANSVNPHFGSSLTLEAKIAHCESAYQERGLPTIFRLTPFSQPENLDSALADLGYDILDSSLMMTQSLDATVESEPELGLTVSRDSWFDTFAALRTLSAFEQASHRRIIESSEGEHVFVAITDNGIPRACELGICVDDSIGLFDLFTHEAYRGQGLGSSVVQSVLGWAHKQGATMAFLQVHSLNTPAQRLYDRLAFTVTYPYWYRIKQ